MAEGGAMVDETTAERRAATLTALREYLTATAEVHQAMDEARRAESVLTAARQRQRHAEQALVGAECGLYRVDRQYVQIQTSGGTTERSISLPVLLAEDDRG